MKSTRSHTVWQKLLENDSLNSVDQSELERLLESESGFADGASQLLADGLIRHSNHILSTQSSFVESVSKRIEEAVQEPSGLASSVPARWKPLPVSRLKPGQAHSEEYSPVSRLPVVSVPGVRPVIRERSDLSMWDSGSKKSDAALPYAKSLPPHSRTADWLIPATVVAAIVVIGFSVFLMMPAEDPPRQRTADDFSPGNDFNLSGSSNRLTNDPSTNSPNGSVVDSTDGSRDSSKIDSAPRNMVHSDTHSPAETRQVPSLKHSQDSEVLGRLVESRNAVWESTPPIDLKRQTLSLLKGAAKIEMRNGAQVLIAAPVKFQVQTTSRLFLNHGNLRAYVPPSAIGFTVETPSSRVVDLGTEFQVLVGDQGETGVRVQTGEVEVSLRKKSNLEGDRRWRLRKGEFKWIDMKGNSHDWSLKLSLDESGKGRVRLNGLEMDLSDSRSFQQAKEMISSELKKFEDEFDSRNSKASPTGVFDLGGTTRKFSDVAEFKSAWSDASRRLSDLEKRIEILRKSVEEIKDATRPAKLPRSQLGGGKLGISKDGVETGDASPFGKARINKDGMEIENSPIGPARISRDGLEFGGLHIGPKGIRPALQNGSPGTGISGRMGSLNRLGGLGQLRNALGSARNRRNQATTKATTGKTTRAPSGNVLTLDVSGAGGKVRILTAEKDPESGTRKVRGARDEIPVAVSPRQKIILNLDGAGNTVWVPAEIRKNVAVNVDGAGNQVQYYTQRARFRERFKSMEQRGDKDANRGSRQSSLSDPLKKVDLNSRRAFSRTESKPDPSTLAADKRKDGKLGPLLLVISGQKNQVNLRQSDENAEPGILVVHGIGESKTVWVGSRQKVMIYQSGIRNQAEVSLKLKPNISGRLKGIENKILFRTPDGRLVDWNELDNQGNARSRKPARGNQGTFLGKPVFTNRDYLLVMVEGENHDVIFRKASRRSDYGVKFVDGISNEQVYSVFPEQYVIVYNKSKDTRLFVQEPLRESVSLESSGGKNSLDYFAE